MNSKLPNATAFLALFIGGYWVVARAQIHRPASAEAIQLVEQAQERLQEYSSLRAKIRYSGRLYGHEVLGTGVYVQEGAADGLKWRSEWNLQIGELNTFRREICNADSLWIEQRTDDHENDLSRVNLRKVRASPVAATARPESIFSGGFPGFLASLSRQVNWTRLESSQMGDDPVWIVHGDMTQPPESLELPNHVRLVMAQTGEFQYFPFRIEWYRRSAKTTERTMVVDYFAISAGATPSAAEFEFDPGDRDYTDTTDSYMK